MEFLNINLVSVLDSAAERPWFRLQPRRCRVTVLGKLYTHCASVHQAVKLVPAYWLWAWWKVMAAYRQVYDLCHLQADCQEPGSAPEPYSLQSSTSYLYLYLNFIEVEQVI